jgi:recombination protein RecR
MPDSLPKPLENLADFFHSIPGVGKKTALRYAIQVFNQDQEFQEAFGEQLIQLKKQIVRCRSCNNISETEICSICSNNKRNKELICVVEDIRDVMAIENTQQFDGVYHVLGGVISPMEGIGPNDLAIGHLIERVQRMDSPPEIIFALSATMEGDTTNYFIYKKIKDYISKSTTIARGISFGDQIEYADQITLGKSIRNRLPYDGNQ